MTFSPLEWAAIAFVVANVILAVYENMWTWPTGIVGVVLYAIVFYQARYYLNVGLQVVYFVLSIHGWYEWLHGGANKSELHVRRTTTRQWIACGIAGVILTAALYWLTLKINGASPISDAVTTGFSVVGQWMLNEKLLENWVIWLIVDLIYVPMLYSGGQKGSAILYAVLCVLCVKGFIDWRKSLASV